VYSINNAAIPATMGAATEVPSLRSVSSFGKVNLTMFAKSDIGGRLAIDAPQTASLGAVYFSSVLSSAEKEEMSPFPFAEPIQIT